MPLATSAQFDFSSGIFRAFARQHIPPTGCWDAPNSLLTSDGSIFKRPGAVYLSTAALDTSLRTIWDGFLVPGQRTFIASPDNWGVLDGSEGVVNLGGAGTSSPKRGAELGEVLFIGDQMYGGSRKTATYSTGTVTLTNGSKAVTGAGTSWLANADAGMLLRRGSERVYPVESVNSDTSITLRDAYEGVTGGGVAYTLHHIFTLAAPYRTSGLWAVAGSRLWSFEDHIAVFSNADDPHTFSTDDNHEFTEPLIGGAGIGDRLIAFTTDGVHQVSGLAYDLTDDFGNVQHRNERVGGQVLWGHEGIAEWEGRLVVPCADHVWLMDGISHPEPATRSITPLYREYVEAGHKPGLGAVFNAHYVLPILTTANAWVDTLVCRLDRPTEVAGIGIVRPFTRWEDYGGEMAGFAVRTGGSTSARDPQLLGASLRSTARVANLTGCFDIEGAKNEPDGTTHTWMIETRDYATGDGTAKSENTVRRVLLRYELVDAATDNPTIEGYYSLGILNPSGSFYGTAFWGTGTYTDAETASDVLLDGSAPEDDGREPHTWHVNQRTRFIRFRFQSASPAKRLVLRTIETKTRLTGKG
jgi:hypothetical protein